MAYWSPSSIGTVRHSGQRLLVNGFSLRPIICPFRFYFSLMLFLRCFSSMLSHVDPYVSFSKVQKNSVFMPILLWKNGLTFFLFFSISSALSFVPPPIWQVTNQLQRNTGHLDLTLISSLGL
jgi:hypothetical protein